MHTVGLFEVKTHLSEYVARAQAGEEVIITRHNKPVAKIVPIDAADGSRAGDRSGAIRAIFERKRQWTDGRTLHPAGHSAGLVRELRDGRWDDQSGDAP